jgi:oligogalacturonide lyase
LTTDPAGDSRIYQTHPQWTHDQAYIIFRSTRGTQADAAHPRQNAFAVNELTGEIIQLTEDPGTDVGSINISRMENKLWYLKRDGERWHLVELDLGRLLADSAVGTSTQHAQADYERVIAAVPEGLSPSGGFGVDADEKTAYLGVNRDGAPVQVSAPPGQHWRIQQTPGGLRAVDIATGRWRTVIDVPFKMGHVQTNPWVPAEIVYCHETGGDSTQRMWTVKADGSGNRPLFEEGPTDWVTHEVVVGPDTGDVQPDRLPGRAAEEPDRHRNRRPAGRSGERAGPAEEEVPEGMPEGVGGPGGFWHCNGSPDGRWAAGDTFRGDLYLIDRRNGRQILLTTGHRMHPITSTPPSAPTASA